jgi:pimeloyl-ACP methyl ester carboxylesterase
LFDALFASGRIGEDPRRHNVIAERHLALSALWHDDDPTSKDLERTLQRVLLTTGVSVPLARAFPDWPRAPGPSSRSLPIYHGPLLLLHGSLDPTMPLERLAEVRRFYSDRGQTFVPVPRAGHVTLNSGACVLGLYRAFLNAPQRPLDTRCVQTAVPAVVTPSRALSMEVFGTGDVWGDGIPQCPAAGR